MFGWLSAPDKGSLPSDEVEIYTSLDDVPVDEGFPPDGDNSLLAPAGEGVGPEPRLFAMAPLKQRRVVPFVRTLKRGMKGKDVLAVKRSLSRAGYLKWTKFTPLFGPIMFRQLKKFQKAKGLRADGVYGPKTHAALARYFDSFSIHLLLSIPKKKTKRDVIVATAILGYNKRSLINYTQSSLRMDGVKHHIHPPQVPHWEDCSSFATWCYWVAGASDPNGLGYSGLGFTGTLATQGRRVSTPKPGDLGLYGFFPYHHVVVYIGNGRCISHGSSVGPLLLNVFYRGDFSHYRSYLA
jgi:hypothetical protein